MKTFFKGGWEIGGKKFSKSSHTILEMDEVFKKSSSLNSTKHGNLNQVFRALIALWTLYWELLLCGKTVLSHNLSAPSSEYNQAAEGPALSVLCPVNDLYAQLDSPSVSVWDSSITHKRLFTARSTCIDTDQEPLWCMCLTVESESNSSKIQDKWCFS